MTRVSGFVAGALVSSLWTLGCDYLSGPELNNDPNNPTTATRDQLLTGIQFNQFTTPCCDAPLGLSIDVSMWTQQMAGTGRFFSASDMYVLIEGGGFRRYYGGGGLVDIRKIETSARADDDRIYLGIARVWEALVIGEAADLWGDIPYSEAVTSVVTPKLDPQAVVYEALQSVLDSAMLDLQSGVGHGPGAIDLAYGGDAARWTEAAHTLKARLYLHTAERDPSAYGKALAEASVGISTVAGDFTAFHSEKPGEENQWYLFTSAGYLSTEAAPGKFLVDVMKALDDPRLPIYFTKAGNGDYGGAMPGQDFDNTTMSHLSDVRGARDFRQPILTWAENQLIKAEAYYRTGNEGQARDELNTELGAVGVPPVTESGSALLTRILQEKYIALFENVEVYNDYKRTCYPNLVPADSIILGGNIPARPYYPGDERNVNPNIPPPEAQPARNWNDPVTPFAPDGSPCRGQRH